MMSEYAAISDLAYFYVSLFFCLQLMNALVTNNTDAKSNMLIFCKDDTILEDKSPNFVRI